MDSPKIPLVFAEQVIHQFVDHLLGRGIESKEMMPIRLVFRKAGGMWEGVMHGDPFHVSLLMRVIKVWGKRGSKDG